MHDGTSKVNANQIVLKLFIFPDILSSCIATICKILRLRFTSLRMTAFLSTAAPHQARYPFPTELNQDKKSRLFRAGIVHLL